MYRQLLVTLIFVSLGSPSLAQFVPNPFDLNSGANTYYSNANLESLADTNWESLFAGLSANSGAKFLASGNGNVNHDFVDIGITKNLGGAIENRTYNFSFYIASYSDRPELNLQPVEFADFSSLRIGGTAGTMLWKSTPTPAIHNQWYKWTGIYTPAASDIGDPFLFTAIFTLTSLHTIAIDGLIEVPEPASCSLIIVAIAVLGAARASSPPKPRPR